jgi:hypothetical protein
MKRDPDLLRNIMLAAEAQPAGKPLFASDVARLCNDPYELADHVEQLIEERYLSGTVHSHGREVRPNILIKRVTAKGHDFLSAMRDDSIWKKVKAKVMTAAGGWTLALAMECAKLLIKERLRLP